MATTTITTNSINHTNSNIKKAAVSLSDGRGITAVMRNLTTVALYFRTTDLYNASWAEALTFTITGAKTGTPLHAMVISPDENYLYFIWLTSVNTVRCRRINISAWTIGGTPSAQWVVGAEEAALTSANVGGTVVALDADVSDSNAVMVAVSYTATTTNDRAGWVGALRDTAGVWHFSLRKIFEVSNTTTLATAFDISVAWFRNAGTLRRFSVFASWGSTTVDKGARWYHNSIKESDGTSPLSVDKGALGSSTVDATWNTWSNGPPRRTFLWQTSDSTLNEQVLAIAKVTKYEGVKGQVTAVKLITVGTSASTDLAEISALSSFGQISSIVLSTTPWRMSATYSKDLDNNHIVNFLAPTTQFSDNVARMRATVFSMKPISVLYGSTVKINSPRWISAGDWDGLAFWPTNLIPTSHVPDYLDRSHSVLFFAYSGSVGTWSYSRMPLPNAPSFTSPATSQVVATSEPVFSLTVSSHITWSWQPPILIPVIQVAQDNSFTTAQQTVNLSEKTLSSGSSTSISEEWPGLDMAPSDTWYHRTKVRDLYGNESPWSTTKGPWKIRHPMNADLLNMSSSSWIPFPYSDPLGNGYSEVPVSWKAVDAWPKDFQTKYQITVQDTALGVIVYDSGVITSSATSAMVQIPFDKINTQLLLIVALWDSYDQNVNTFDSIGAIIVYEPPVISDVSLVTVDGDGFANSNKPIFNYEITDNLYPLLQLVWILSKGSTIAGFSLINNPPEIGVIDTSTATAPYDVNLENLTDYTLGIAIVDANMLSSAGGMPFTTKWSPPTPPTGVSVSLAEYNAENGGGVLVQWDGFDASDDFLMWKIYRVVDLIDSFGNVVDAGELELIYSDGANSDIMTFRDYFAPSGHRVGYIVHQVVNMFGSVVESVNDDPEYVYPVSDGYWLIDPTPEDNTASAFKLHNVTGDSYQHEYEEEVIHVIGKGRHVDRGDDLGVNGSLTCQIRDTGLTTARQKKLRLDAIKKEVRSLFLRTPFGDAWFVSVGNMDVSRIAGVGSSEFVDVTIPYIEVYQ